MEKLLADETASATELAWLRDVVRAAIAELAEAVGGASGRRTASRQDALAPRDQSLVCLLACGYTDAAIARRLRISPRTVGTLTNALMRQFRVSSRFQLGLVLGAELGVRPRDPD